MLDRRWHLRLSSHCHPQVDNTTQTRTETQLVGTRQLLSTRPGNASYQIRPFDLRQRLVVAVAAQDGDVRQGAVLRAEISQVQLIDQVQLAVCPKGRWRLRYPGVDGGIEWLPLRSRRNLDSRGCSSGSSLCERKWLRVGRSRLRPLPGKFRLVLA